MHLIHPTFKVQKLQKNITDSFLPNEPQLADSLKKTIDNGFNNASREQELTFGNIKPPIPIVPKTNNFNDFDVAEVARQLCLFESTLFRLIHPKECLNQSWNKKKERSPHIIRMIDHFNDVSGWVATQIVTNKKLADRMKTIKKFIRIMGKCREFNNFNACQEILAAFAQSSVFRLKKTWTKFEKTEKELFRELQEYKAMMATDKSYSLYRRTLKAADPPCLPYLGVFLTDLTFIEEGNQDYLTVEDGRGDIINFEKLRKVATVIEQIIIYQQKPYHFEKVDVIFEYFNNLTYLPEAEAFKVSRENEPKEEQ